MAKGENQVSTYVDDETKRHIRMAAAASDKNISEWLHDAAERQLEKDKEKFRVAVQ